ncbi:MAG: hypothetical protein QF885_05115 [Candidatus Thalassarchaeaceae archaeon]|nr:hypothetical protein [Candidatus Thalassarchaeaceae archaeon]
MVEAIYIPSFPPGSPYEAYIYMLTIPLFLRLILVMPPLIDLIQKYSPDRMILWQAVNSLKIKGLWVIVFNEVLALLLPFILALYARTLFDPIGWTGWEDIPSRAIYALIAAGALWMIGDFMRVARTRRLMRSVSERNRIMVKVAAKGIVHARGVLGFMEKLRIGGKPQQELAASNEDSTENDAPKKSILNSLLNLGGAASGKGAEVADAALGVVRDKATELTNKMDDQIQRGIQQQSKVAIKLLLRDLVMSIAPIVVLVGLYNVW